MTDTERAELKRLAEAYAKGNMRRSAEGLAPALVGVDPAAVLDLLAENERLRALGQADWNACCDALRWARELGSDMPQPSRAVAEVIGRLATEETERIRCRDGWAVAKVEIERLKAAARNVLAHLHDRHAPIQAGEMGIEDPSGINAALDALDDAVEGRGT